MLRHIALFLFLLSACSDDTAPNQETVLRGHWGSDEAELIAIGAGAELRFICASAVTDEAITLTGDNTFVAAARVNGSMARLGPDPVVRVSGSLAGTRLTVSVPSVSSEQLSGGTYVLEAGVELPPLEEPICPQ